MKKTTTTSIKIITKIIINFAKNIIIDKTKRTVSLNNMT